MIVSDQRPPGEDWLVRRIVDLERQVRELQAGRRLEAATIGAGGITIRGGAVRVLDDSGVEVLRVGKAADGRYGLRVNDAEGNPQIRAGELAAGGYGLEAVDPVGQLVALSTLAFGLVADSNVNNDFTSSTTYTDLSSTVGPAVTTAIGPLGRCIVILGCTTDIDNTEPNWSGGAMGFEVSGATSVLPFDHLAITTELNVNVSNVEVVAHHLIDGKSKLIVLEGLNPGAHTFTAKYKTMVSGDTASFKARSIAVLPY